MCELKRYSDILNDYALQIEKYGTFKFIEFKFREI